MAAMRRRGTRVGAARVGPDFIDPGYHRLATGQPSRDLDGFLAPPSLLFALAAAGRESRDILVVEGVMGLFDGAYGSGQKTRTAGLAVASTASVADTTKTPVVLVVDASAMNQSVALSSTATRPSHRPCPYGDLEQGRVGRARGRTEEGTWAHPCARSSEARPGIRLA